MGTSGHEFMNRYQDSSLKDRLILTGSLEEAVKKAYEEARNTDAHLVVMSPAAASFDMFENVYDRGDQYQKIVKSSI